MRNQDSSRTHAPSQPVPVVQSVAQTETQEQLESQIRELQSQNDLLWKAANGQLLGQLKKVEDQHFQQKHASPCPELRDQLAQCYERHKHAPLNCSPLVRQFAECTRQARKKLI